MKKGKVILIILLVLTSLTVNCFATNEIEQLNNNTQNNTENNTENNNQNTTNDTPGTQNMQNENNNNATNQNEQPELQQTNNEGQSNNTNINQSGTQNAGSNPNSTSSNYSNTHATSTQSNNARLKSLAIDVLGMKPDFNADVKEYSVKVSEDVNTIKVNVSTEDNNARATVTGNTNLVIGENKIEITVTAENGEKNIYSIIVTKTEETEETNADLKTLEINNFRLYPEFKSKIYNYSLNINEKITALEIKTETEIEGATYVIEGNENLQEGDNIIKIIVTAKDGETKREYKINTFISTKKAEPFQMNRKQAYGLIAVLTLAILVTGVFVIKNKNN